MNIADSLEKVRVALDGRTSEPLLKYVPDVTGPRVKAPRVAHGERADGLAQALLSVADHKMHVVAHETPRDNVDPASDEAALHEAEKRPSVGIVLEDLPLAIASQDDVIEPAFRNRPRLTHVSPSPPVLS